MYDFEENVKNFVGVVVGTIYQNLITERKW